MGDQTVALKEILESLKSLTDEVKNQREDFKSFRETEFAAVQEKLEKTVTAHDGRILVLEGAQARTDDCVKDIQAEVQRLSKGHDTACKYMGDFHAHLKIVEQFIEQQQEASAIKPAVVEKKQMDWTAKDYKSFLIDEMECIDMYEKENSTCQNLVVIGPKPTRLPVTQTDIENYLRKELVPLEAFQVFVRGKNGVHAVVFHPVQGSKTSPGMTGQALAMTFRDEFPKMYSNMWATIDQNCILREGRKRARDFGEAYKKKHGQAVWWRINDNLLILDELVVGSVTLIPGKKHWGSLAAKITTARQTQTRKLSFETRLSNQVNIRTFAHCVKIHRSSSFLEEDDASVFDELPDNEEDLGLDQEDEIMPDSKT
jgi:hypothetical protein